MYLKSREARNDQSNRHIVTIKSSKHACRLKLQLGGHSFSLKKNCFNSKNSYIIYHQSVKQFRSRSGLMFCQFVLPDLDPNSLQKLSADNISRQRVNKTYFMDKTCSCSIF